MAPSRIQRRVRSARGASTVEVAVSMILLVPTTLYAIYAGEAFLAGTHAQETEIAASWDLTGYRLHDYLSGQDFETGDNGEKSFYQQTTDRVTRRVAREMGQLDSYHARGSGGQRGVISHQELEEVKCEPMDARNVMGGALLTFQATPYPTREFLHRGGYVSCQAKVRFDPQFVPKDLRDVYSSKEKLLSGRLASGFPICGSGDTLWGCEAKDDRTRPGILVLTNDWGLEDSLRNRVGQKDNLKYYQVGEKVYQAKVEGQDTDLAGGLGHQQVKEVLQLLLDEEDKDYGDTSTFKLGFYNPMGTLHRYPANNHSGQDDAHLSPWDDGEGPYTSDRNVHDNARGQHTYLGHPRANFLDQSP